jgi:hypothetical protein
VPISRVNSTDNNITTIIGLLQNGTVIIADNLENIETFTFSYKLSFPDWSWCDNDFFYVSLHGSYMYDININNTKNDLKVLF